MLNGIRKSNTCLECAWVEEKVEDFTFQMGIELGSEYSLERGFDVIEALGERSEEWGLFDGASSRRYAEL